MKKTLVIQVEIDCLEILDEVENGIGYEVGTPERRSFDHTYDQAAQTFIQFIEKEVKSMLEVEKVNVSIQKRQTIFIN